jgi:hypothetical protein
MLTVSEGENNLSFKNGTSHIFQKTYLPWKVPSVLGTEIAVIETASLFRAISELSL